MIKKYQIIVLMFVLIVSYHNCSPSGTSSAPATAGTGSVPVCPYQSNPAPVLQGIFSDAGLTQQINSINYRVGMGNDAGNEAARTVYLRGLPGDNYSQIISVECDTGNSGLDANCDVNNNQLRVRITPAQDGECLQGAATVQIRLEDSVSAPGCQALAATSSTLNLTVNMTNACLPTVRMNPPDNYAAGQMGLSVATDGNWAVTAVPGDEEAGTDAGAAYVYLYNGSQWTLFDKLVPSSIASQSYLNAVAISGNTIVLGSELFSNEVGRAWIFQYNGSAWVEVKSLSAPTPTSGERFGSSVAISSGVIAVGAPRNAAQSFRSGSAYLFSGANFDTVQAIYPSLSGQIANDVITQGEFGTTVALQNGTLAVGASFPNASTSRKESVYIFKGAGFTLSQKIVNADGNDNKRFGRGLALSGNSLIVGAPFLNANNLIEVGRAYVYTRTNSSSNFDVANPRALNPLDPADRDHFGQSLALNATHFYVGAPDKQFDGMAKVGAVYQYDLQGVQRFKIRSRKADRDNDSFGTSIAVGMGWLMSGAFNDEHDINYLNSGSVYFVDVP